jgi:hypothetical protein
MRGKIDKGSPMGLGAIGDGPVIVQATPAPPDTPPRPVMRPPTFGAGRLDGPGAVHVAPALKESPKDIKAQRAAMYMAALRQGSVKDTEELASPEKEKGPHYVTIGSKYKLRDAAMDAIVSWLGFDPEKIVSWDHLDPKFPPGFHPGDADVAKAVYGLYLHTKEDSESFKDDYTIKDNYTIRNINLQFVLELCRKKIISNDIAALNWAYKNAHDESAKQAVLTSPRAKRVSKSIQNYTSKPPLGSPPGFNSRAEDLNALINYPTINASEINNPGPDNDPDPNAKKFLKEVEKILEADLEAESKKSPVKYMEIKGLDPKVANWVRNQCGETCKIK